MTEREELKPCKLSPEELRFALEYDPETGRFTWKHRDDRRKQYNAQFAGKDALTATNGVGYLVGRVNYVKVYAYRAAWAIHYGDWPEIDLDHINGDKSDNRIANLRLATQSQNEMNKPAVSGKTSKFKGVSWDKRRGKWVAQIGAFNVKHHLGHFTNELDARDAYNAAAINLHGDYINTREAPIMEQEG